MATTTSYTYDSDDRLTREVRTQGVSSQTTTYAWDANGNLLQKTEPAQTTLYAWDSNNRLMEVKRGATAATAVSVATYQYDANGNRVGKTTAGQTIKYLVDSNLPYAQVAEETATTTATNATSTATYLYGLERIQQTRAGQGTYYHPDGLGSTRLLTDATGNATDSYDYDDYGALQSQTGTTKNDFLFAGEQFDVEANLYYNRARYLDTNTGRFTGLDPFDGIISKPITLNKYAYAGNDPVNATDPSGLMTLTELNTAQEGQSVLTRISTEVIQFVGKREWMLFDVEYNYYKHRFIWARKLGAGSTLAYGYHVTALPREMARSRRDNISVEGLFSVIRQPRVDMVGTVRYRVNSMVPVIGLTKNQLAIWSIFAAGQYVGECIAEVPYEYNIPDRDCTQWTEKAAWLARWVSLIRI